MSKLMNLTGNIVDIFDLQKEDISAEVIILGACRINRFLGQTKYAYPVAAHLIGGYRYLEYIKASKTLMKQWLIHEAFESYSGVDKIKVCVAYNYNGERIDYMPSNMDNVEAIYEEIDGWDSVVGIRKYEDLPINAKKYIEKIEEITNVKVGIISTSPERDDTILRG
jgi:hypothetical protein